MIESITVYQKPDGSDAFTMVLNDPHNVTDHSGFAIENIDGLGPVDADINMTEMVIDGDQFNSARIGKRNIVFDLVYYGEYGNDIQGVRRRSYSLFPVKKQIYIEIETDDRVVWTKGYVEKNEPDIFSSECKSQVSILCGDPKLYDASGAVKTYIDPDTETEIEYTGDVSVGGYLTIDIVNDIPETVAAGEVIYRVYANDSVIEILNRDEGGFVAGDSIVIGSIPGNKSCIWIDEAEAEHNALHLLNKNPDWITINAGSNSIRVNGATPELTETLGTITFENPICYEGV